VSLKRSLTDGNWQKQFDELDRMISASGARILITVDDVDRLHGEEILTLIKTIRMLGRFHNVHYVLAYDHAALVDALSPGLGGNRTKRAAEYLEKIVQYPLDIPPAQEVQLQAMLDEGLSPLFSAGRRDNPERRSRSLPASCTAKS
jgi:predicted KAP-like P-loop ATPase